MSQKINMLNIRIHKILVIQSTNKKNNESPVWICKCDCGKILELTTKQLRKYNRKSCGCDIKDRRKAWVKSGVNHHWYNKLNLGIRTRRRKGQNFSFIKSVFIRDKYQCQKCHIKCNKLVVHHLDGFHWYTIGRENPDNGITLCESCHKLFHKIYGKMWNTKQQFLQFIGKSYE